MPTGIRGAPCSARTRVVSYGKFGPGRFLNRETGAEHLLETPSFYASNMFDSWAPDGKHFLVQSSRQDETPGFYLMDPDGQLAFRWHEEGCYSHRGRWAPDHPDRPVR